MKMHISYDILLDVELFTFMQLQFSVLVMTVNQTSSFDIWRMGGAFALDIITNIISVLVDPSPVCPCHRLVFIIAVYISP